MSCPLEPTITFQEYFRARRRSDGLFDRMPVHMSIELTPRCNVSCVHCYFPPPGSSSASEGDVLTTGEVEDIIDQAAELGVLWVLFTGGEPLLRRDFSHLYMYAKRKGLFTAVFTNAILLDDEIADMFATYPPTTIEITVHSMDPQVFDAVTQVPGSYEACMAGIERLHGRGLKFNLKTIAFRLTRDSLADVADFADSVGAGHRFDSNLLPRRGTGLVPEGERLTPEEVVALDDAFPGRISSWSDVFRSSGKPLSDRVYGCGAGLRSFWIDSFGRLSTCALTGHSTYDLRQGTLRDAWSRFIPEEIVRCAKSEYVCGSCDLANICGRCPGWSALETGDEEAPVPYLCEIGRLRKRAILEYRDREERDADDFGDNETAQRSSAGVSLSG